MSDNSNLKYWAITDQERTAAWGVGLSEEEAQADARAWNIDPTGGRLMQITKVSYGLILAGDASALAPQPGSETMEQMIAEISKKRHSEAMSAAGKLGAASKSLKLAAARARNGKLGGRPRKWHHERRRAIARLEECKDSEDADQAHHVADSVLVAMLQQLGFSDVTDAWEQVEKNY